MGKKLITIKNLREMYNNGETTLYMNDQIIILPSAIDFAHEKGIKVIHREERPKRHYDLKARITNILKENYCITDENDINKIIKKVLELLDLKT